MPELPEVQSFRNYIDDTSLHQKIARIKLSSPGWLLETSARLLKQTLEGNSFEITFRHGKFLFIQMNAWEFVNVAFRNDG